MEISSLQKRKAGAAVKRLSKGELLATITAACAKDDTRVTAMTIMHAPAALPSQELLTAGKKRKAKRLSRGHKLTFVTLARSLEDAKASIYATRVPPLPRLELPLAPYLGDNV
jgi:hypothetical protein